MSIAKAKKMPKAFSIIFLVIYLIWIVDGKCFGTGSREGSKLVSSRNSSNPAVNSRLAGIARQILRQSTWGDLATLSSCFDNTVGYPFVAPKDFAEGNTTISTGKPYFYIPTVYYPARDAKRDTRVSFTVTMEQSGACSRRGLDVQSPHCYWVVYNGNFKKLEKDSKEYEEGYWYFKSKYPNFQEVTDKEKYFIGTIDLVDVMVVAGRRELECIPLDDYFNTPPNENFENEFPESK